MAKKRTGQPDLTHIHADLRGLAVPLDSLTPDPRNARKHSDANLAAIRESFARWGVRKPIVVQRSGGELIVRAGNGRCAVARELGWTHLPAIAVEEGDEEAIAFALADNRTADLAEWDEDVLAELAGSGLELDWGAFGWADLAGSAGELEGLEMGGFDADETEGGEAGELESDPLDDLPSMPEGQADPITQPAEVVQLGPHVLHCADCMDVLRGLPDCSVDAIVTDPPYGLSPDGRARTWDEIEALRAEGKGPKAGFMGREWDAGVPGIAWARECLRVLKPGGHIIAFSATRTVHRLTVALEDAGFEVRDQIAWVQYQGFPKSLDVSKAIDKMHGAERDVVGHTHVNNSRFAVSGSGVAQPQYANRNIPIYGTPATPDAQRWAGWGTSLKPAIEPAVLARKPLSEPTVAANVLKWGTGTLNIDACRYAYGDQAWPGPHGAYSYPNGPGGNTFTVGGPPDGTRHVPVDNHALGRWPANLYACPKPARSEREAGTDDVDGPGHPTVKPVRLMRWLLRLVTPPSGTVVEPFGGSGTTLVAASGLDCRVIAAEREPAYCDIIRARVTHALERD